MNDCSANYGSFWTDKDQQITRKTFEFFAHSENLTSEKSFTAIHELINGVVVSEEKLVAEKLQHFKKTRGEPQKAKKLLESHNQRHDVLKLNRDLQHSPFMLVRRHFIMLRLMSCNVIVFRDRCLLMPDDGCDSFLQPIKARLDDYYMHNEEGNGGTFSAGLQARNSYELDVLEVLLLATCKEMKKNYQKWLPIVEETKKGFRKMQTEALEKMHKLKKRLFDSHTQGVALTK